MMMTYQGQVSSQKLNDLRVIYFMRYTTFERNNNNTHP